MHLPSPVKDDKQDELASMCLHCGTDSFYDVNISLGAHKYPVFLPLQKPPKQVSVFILFLLLYLV